MSLSNTPSLEELDRKHLLHPQTSLRAHQSGDPRIFESAGGVYVYDQHGRKVIDGVAGLWCVNIGYGREELANAMAQQSAKLAYYHSFTGASNPPQIKLAERLIAMTPEPLAKVFFGMGGSDANDTLVKIAWRYQIARGKPEKRKIIGRLQGYHGTTAVAASLTGLPAFHAQFGLPLDGFLHTACPHHYRFARDDESETDFAARLGRELEELILREDPDTICAFIAEPVMGAGGVIAPPQGYFDIIQPILRKHDILFIVDEVICGFGRLGAMFGSEIYNLRPDMMAAAKGLTSGYFPMSASIISDEIFDAILADEEDGTTFAHGFTYGGHPVGAAVALANLDIIEREGLVARSAETGAYFHEQLQTRLAGHPHIGEIRGLGLIAGVQLVEDADARKFFDPGHPSCVRAAAATYEAGAVVRSLPALNTIALSPPLTISRPEVDALIDCLARGVDAAFAE
ncbi:MAG: aspartate aminotransferase family protein [Parvularculaceae bacterium]